MHMPSDRVHIVMAAEDRAAYVAAADRAGISLSEWLRGAARQRLEDEAGPALDTVAELDAFFAECDEVEGDRSEPNWDEHLQVMAASRGRGLPE